MSEVSAVLVYMTDIPGVARLIPAVAFDAMSAEEVKEYINKMGDVGKYTLLKEQLIGCSFACVKRTYEKYFGYRPVSTMSRERVQTQFRLSLCANRAMY